MVTVPDDLSLMTPFVLAEQGDWFEGEIRFVRRWLDEGMAVVDVGANYGLYTLTCAQRVGTAGRVWAYEPASLPRSCLAHSLAANGLSGVRLFGRALSDHVGTARLGVSANAELNSLNLPGGSGETVPLTTLDAEAAVWDRPVDFLKLDAEGEEVRILAGARAFFAAQDPLVMFEYNHGDAVNRGLLEAVAGLGLSLYRHLPGLNVLVPIARVAALDPFQLNVFACRSGRAGRLAEGGLLVDRPAELPPAGSAVPLQFAAASSGAPALPGAEQSLLAVADLRRGEEEGLPPAVRLALQRRGFAAIRNALSQRATVPRLLTAARVALDLGERAISAGYLQRAAALLTAQSRPQAEPFLPAARWHDALVSGEPDPAVWAVLVDEPLLERSAFSLYFHESKAVPLLRRIAGNERRTPWAERRLAAARRIMPAGSF